MVHEPFRKLQVMKSWIRSDIKSNDTQFGSLGPENFIFPVFVSDSTNEHMVKPIQALPGHFRFGTESVVDYLRPLVENYDLRAVILFGVVDEKYHGDKDPEGSLADAVNHPSRTGISYVNPVCRALHRLKSTFGDSLLLIADVCLCSYTSTGHCGIMTTVKNVTTPDAPRSYERLAKVAITYAQSGADIIAPSDMIVGRIGPMRKALDASGFSNVPIMSYAVKYCSAFYGPFRSAVSSAPESQGNALLPPVSEDTISTQYAAHLSTLPKFHENNYIKYFDRSSYQLDPATSTETLCQIVRNDVSHGAAFVIVKPSVCYMDVVHRVSEVVEVPVGVYHTSGEYCQLFYAAEHKAISLAMALDELMIAFQRSGATFIISYLTPFILKRIKERVVHSA